MKCPHCTDTTLVMSDRQGIEIDYCPQCRGVWLDRGELDKLIDRSAGAGMAPAMAAAGSGPAAATGAGTAAARAYPPFEDSDFGQRRNPHDRRRKSWLSELFD
jgi:Zn-finger nucleic acid-binding protein